jgi:phage gpG-like protein
MKVNYSITGSSEAAGSLKAQGGAVTEAAVNAVKRLTFELQAYVQSDKLSGQVLHVRTGNLRNSVNSQFATEDGQFTGRVGTGIAYAAIHEFGGTIQRHMKPGVVRLRTDAEGNLLHQGEGKLANLAVFAKKSHADSRVKQVAYEGKDYEIVMPMRSFLRSALTDKRDYILAEIRAAALGVLK